MQRCPNCGSTMLIKAGSSHNRRQLRCNVCRRYLPVPRDERQNGSRSMDRGCPKGGPSCAECRLPYCIEDRKKEYGHSAAVC